MVTKSTGEKVEAEINAAFEINDFGRKYVIYSFGETDPNGLAKLNVSQVLEDGGKYTFANIESDDEWNRIKGIMRDMITGTNPIDTVINLDNLETTITGNKNIAVPNDGPTKIANSYSTALSKLAPAPEPEVQAPANTAPAVDITVNNDTPTDTLFEQAPAELNPKTPLDSMVEPFNIETPTAAPVEPIVEQPAASVIDVQPTPTVNTQPAPATEPVVTEPIAAANTLSDAEFIKQFEELVNKTGIRQQTIKEQMRRRIEDLLMLAKNMDYIEDKVNEMADVVKATNEMVKASNTLNQAPVQATPTQTANVAPTIPITPAPQTTTNQASGGTTPVQAAPGGPTLTYQQAA